MTDDLQIRGMIHMREYVKLRQELELVREELRYAQWMLGNGAGDDERCVIAGHRLKLRRGDIRFLLTMIRAAPRVMFAVDHVSSKVYACRIRAAIRKDGGNPRMIQTVDLVGYQVTSEGIEWMKGWIPELFRPLAEVARDYTAPDFKRSQAATA